MAAVAPQVRPRNLLPEDAVTPTCSAYLSTARAPITAIAVARALATPTTRKASRAMKMLPHADMRPEKAKEMMEVSVARPINPIETQSAVIFVSGRGRSGEGGWDIVRS